MPTETCNYLRTVLGFGHDLKGEWQKLVNSLPGQKLQSQPTTEAFTHNFDFKIFSQHHPSLSI